MANNKTTRRASIDAVVKKDICNATMELIKRRKSCHFTMDLVAKEIGMTRANLYKYFESKSVLTTYMIEKMIEPYEKQSDLVMESDVPPMEKLLIITELNMRIATEHNDFLSIMLESISHEFLLKTATESGKRQSERLVRIFEGGIRSGLFRGFAMPDLITAYSGVMGGFANRRLAGHSERSAAEDAKIVVDIFARGACA